MVERDSDGQYTSGRSDDDVLAAVRAHEPAATSEVAEELGITRQGADKRLRNLRDEARVVSKKIGASLVWFDPNGTDHAGDDPQERIDDVVDRLEGVDPDPTNPAIQNWAEKIDVSPEELADAVAEEYGGIRS